MIKPFMGFANDSFYLLVVSHLAWPVLMTRNTWRIRSSARINVSLRRESLYKGANTSLGSAVLDKWIELNSYPPKAKRNTRVQKNFVPASLQFLNQICNNRCWNQAVTSPILPVSHLGQKEGGMQTRRFAFAMYANCHFSCRFIAHLWPWWLGNSKSTWPSNSRGYRRDRQWKVKISSISNIFLIFKMANSMKFQTSHKRLQKSNFAWKMERWKYIKYDENMKNVFWGKLW